MNTSLLYLDKQVRADTLCASQNQKTKETMVGLLSNEEIYAWNMEENPQPYLAYMRPVHQDNCTFKGI